MGNGMVSIRKVDKGVRKRTVLLPCLPHIASESRLRASTPHYECYNELQGNIASPDHMCQSNSTITTGYVAAVVAGATPELHKDLGATVPDLNNAICGWISAIR